MFSVEDGSGFCECYVLFCLAFECFEEFVVLVVDFGEGFSCGFDLASDVVFFAFDCFCDGLVCGACGCGCDVYFFVVWDLFFDYGGAVLCGLGDFVFVGEFAFFCEGFFVDCEGLGCGLLDVGGFGFGV